MVTMGIRVEVPQKTKYRTTVPCKQHIQKDSVSHRDPWMSTLFMGLLTTATEVP